MSDWVQLRPARLNDEPLGLFGRLPQAGDRLLSAFSLPPARLADRPLTERELSRGLVLLSTLPNIERHACLAQIVELEEQASERLSPARIIHVSSDSAHHWCEVDRYHPSVRARAYSLVGADQWSRMGFKWDFGVGVLGRERIAHGLFALREGVFLAADVPYDQMRPPSVEALLREVSQTLRGPHAHK